jgi:hypothetical protein
VAVEVHQAAVVLVVMQHQQVSACLHHSLSQSGQVALAKVDHRRMEIMESIQCFHRSQPMAEVAVVRMTPTVLMVVQAAVVVVEAPLVQAVHQQAAVTQVVLTQTLIALTQQEAVVELQRLAVTAVDQLVAQAVQEQPHLLLAHQ